VLAASFVSRLLLRSSGQSPSAWLKALHWHRPANDVMHRFLGPDSLRPSCAIVGSAPNLTSAQLGAQIDAHDVVIRSNFAPTAGYEAHVGSRTEMRVMAHTYVPADPDEGSVIVHRYSSRRYARDDIVGNCNRSVVRLVAPWLLSLGKGKTRRLTTSGLVGVMLGMLACSNVTIFGFDLAGASRGHYFDDERSGLIYNLQQLTRHEPWRLRLAPSSLYIEPQAGTVELANASDPNSVVVRLRSARSYSEHVAHMYSTSNDHDMPTEHQILTELVRSGCIGAAGLTAR
jgi:hypothetical protein